MDKQQIGQRSRLLADAYERREELELLLYEAQAMRTATLKKLTDRLQGGLAKDGDAKIREQLLASTRALLTISIRLRFARRRVRMLSRRPP